MALAMQDPTTGRFVGPDTSVDLLDRVIEKINFDGPDGCWVWRGSLDTHGYGRTWDGQHVRQAHRVVYEVLVGPLAVELDLDHLCHNADRDCPGGSTCRHRACVHPDHLEPAGRRTNLLRGRGPAAEHAAQTHCLRGHPFDDANTYRYRNMRMCRACHRQHERDRKARLRGSAPS